MHRYMVSIGGPGVDIHTKDGVVCALVTLTDEEKDKISPRDLINVVLNKAGIKVEEISTPQDACDDCRATGIYYGGGWPVQCKTCGGSGRLKKA